MTLSSKDIEKAHTEPVDVHWSLKFIAWIFHFFTSLPWIRNKYRHSPGSLSGQIFRCQEEGDFEKAARIAIFAMERYREYKDRLNPGMEHHQWWQFVQHACESASKTENRNIREKIIYEATRGIKPFEGYYVAFSFLEISKWEHEVGEVDHAVQAAEMASKADPTWAEPDYILGRIGLLTGEVLAENHLSDAVKKDKRILFRISKDDLCKQYPHIVARLKKLYSANEE